MRDETASVIRKLRGGVLVGRTLRDKGVDCVFTLSGGFINPILEGLQLYGIRVVNAPHEQVAGHLADGTARLTVRRPRPGSLRVVATKERLVAGRASLAVRAR